MVVQSTTSSAGGGARQVLNVEVKEQTPRQQQQGNVNGTTSRSGRFSFTSAVDLNWRGSQVKELQQHHQQRHRQQERNCQSDVQRANDVFGELAQGKATDFAPSTVEWCCCCCGFLSHSPRGVWQDEDLLVHVLLRRIASE